ncbi:hypothetical protein GQ53DRAFT_127389 [Thozetella sp. PMI_491]|nr:hypothetical protein GQ53DRAFT_127389 [Thozetella sp. PMI_491]
MDQGILERLLEDPSLFAPTGNHRAIEIHLPPDSTEAHVSENILAEKQVAPWVRNSTFTGPGSLFKLLVCSPRIAERDIWPFPLSSSSLSSILDSLEIPPLFPRAICRHIPLATQFDCFDSPKKYGILLRTNLSHTWQYALAMTIDKSNNTTTAVLLGLRSNEIMDVMISLRHAAKRLRCPSALPCILMDKSLDALVRDAEERRKNLTQIRFETGSHGFPQANDKEDMLDDRDDLDLDMLMQKLTGLSDACAGITAVCKMQTNFIDVLSGFQLQLDPEMSDTASRYTRQQLRFFQQFLYGVDSKVAYTKSSVQDQVQTIYTLINLRENRSQMVLAKTSRRLAELSRKDSTDMRVISAVTLVFLPATFMSTFFSASFFNFQPEEASHMSPWIWLYWVITASLTAVVLGLWWYFSRRQHDKALEVVRRDSRREHVSLEQVRSDRMMPEIFGRLETFRPYLGGSVAEGMFARKVSIPFSGPNRTMTENISPTASP